MYTLYVRQLKSFTNLSDTRDFFKKYWDHWFKLNTEYNEAYAAKALKKYEEIYEKKISSIPEKEQLSYTEEILNNYISEIKEKNETEKTISETINSENESIEDSISEFSSEDEIEEMLESFDDDL